MTDARNDGRLDRLARTLAKPRPRRAALFAGIAALTAGVLSRTAAQTTTGGYCIAQGLPCSMGATCCNGYCAPNSLYNPNVGVCTSGTRPASTVATTPTPPPKTRTKYALKRVTAKLDCFEKEVEAGSPARKLYAHLSVLNNSATSISINELLMIGANDLGSPSFPRTVIEPAPTQQDPNATATVPLLPVSLYTGNDLFVELGWLDPGEEDNSFRIAPRDYFWDTGKPAMIEGKKSPMGVRISTNAGDLKAFCDHSRTQKYNKLKRKRQRRKNRR